MFSATMPKAIADMASQFMKMPWRIEVAPAGTTAAKIEQEIFIAPKDVRLQLLDKLLAENKGTVLIFSRTKHGATKISKAIMNMGHSSVEIHSNRSLPQRQAAMAGFKNGKFRILVATDIAARGIDVNDISLVINYDLPDNKDDYVHRIGRTGRAGKTGKAISFAGPDERMAIRMIERLIKKTIPVLALPVLPPKRPMVFTPRVIPTNNRTPYSGRNTRDSKPFRSRTKKFNRY
jgi:ATP-dependent RNA helicase RhlE